MITTAKNSETAILVTGKTGIVGSEVIKQLSPSLFQIFKFRAAVHSENKTDKLRSESKPIEFVNTDYNKPETIINTVRGVDKLWYSFTN
jgi:uncharacterized protein YbjT (DUF2867 family)